MWKISIAPPNTLFRKQDTTSFTKMGSPKVSVVLPGRSRQNFVAPKCKIR